MSRSELDLNPVQHITSDAIGKPGQRVFYLQGWRESDIQPVTLILEKLQLQTLATGLDQLLVAGPVARPHFAGGQGRLVDAGERVLHSIDDRGRPRHTAVVLSQRQEEADSCILRRRVGGHAPHAMAVGSLSRRADAGVLALGRGHDNRRIRHTDRAARVGGGDAPDGLASRGQEERFERRPRSRSAA